MLKKYEISTLCIRIYLGQLDIFLSRHGQEFQISSMSHDITDELLDAISILKFVQVGQCPFLVFKDFVRFLHPDLESANFGFELDQFFLGRVHSFQKLVRIVGNKVITFFELFSLRLQFVEFRGCKEKMILSIECKTEK